MAVGKKETETARKRGSGKAANETPTRGKYNTAGQEKERHELREREI